MDKIHLNRYLAHLGLVSRRKADELIRDGQVKVNGQLVLKPETLIIANVDQVLIDDQVINKNPQLEYFLLNKPLGVISTVSDELNRKTVVDLVKTTARVYPVGRLDENTSGLLVLTNDGELTYKLTHPKFHILKTYQVLVKGEVSDQKIRNLQNGVVLKDGQTSPAQIKILKSKMEKTLLEITIHEGRNRQVRRMMAAVGLEVFSLKRVAIGPLKIGNLRKGEYRRLKDSEVQVLKEYIK